MAKSSSILGTLVAIALVAALIYFVVLPAMKKGKGAVIISRTPSSPSSQQRGGGTSSSSQASSLSGELRDYGGGEWEGWLTRMDKTIAEMYPAKPLPGAKGPYIRAVNIRYDPMIFNNTKGWYYIEVKACYSSKNCGCGTKTAAIGPYNFTKGIRFAGENGGVYTLKGWNPYPTLGGRQVNVLILGQSLMIPPESIAWLPLQSWLDDAYFFAVDTSGRARSKVNFYLARDYLEKILPNCDHPPTDELKVYSRLLWAPPTLSLREAGDISKYKVLEGHDWELQADVQIDFGPHAGESPSVSENYANGGVEFVSVNGYVNMIMWPQSPFQPPTIVNLHFVVATIAFLAISALIIWWRLRR